MAAEKMQRACVAIEMDPSMCDVIVQRWEKHTGRKAERYGREEG
jgi:DNA modification methylase